MQKIDDDYIQRPIIGDLNVMPIIDEQKFGGFESEHGKEEEENSDYAVDISYVLKNMDNFIKKDQEILEKINGHLNSIETSKIKIKDSSQQNIVLGSDCIPKVLEINVQNIENPKVYNIGLDGAFDKFEYFRYKSEHLKELKCDDIIIAIQSGFINEYGEEYSSHLKKKTSNRGRKKKQKIPTDRRNSADYKNRFNSQVTFFGITHELFKILKIKLFNGGKVQVSGQKPEYFPYLIFFLQYLANKIYEIEKKYDPELPEPILSSLIPKIKNYKTRVLGIDKNCYIDAEKLRHYMHHYNENAAVPFEHPRLCPEFTVLSNKDLKFEFAIISNIRRPNEKEGKKKNINLTIYIGKGQSKINIKGAHDEIYTEQICRYLDWVLTTHPDIINKKPDTSAYKKYEWKSGKEKEYRDLYEKNIWKFLKARKQDWYDEIINEKINSWK